MLVHVVSCVQGHGYQSPRRDSGFDTNDQKLKAYLGDLRSCEVGSFGHVLQSVKSMPNFMENGVLNWMHGNFLDWLVVLHQFVSLVKSMRDLLQDGVLMMLFVVLESTIRIRIRF